MKLAKHLFMKSKAENGHAQTIDVPPAAWPARYDALTNLLTHATFQNELKKYFDRRESPERELACAIFDIDYFHAINRRFGFDFGDAILAQIAALVRHMISPEILLSRFSGEQFALAWLIANREQAIELAERIRKKISETNFQVPGFETYLTVSCGLAVSDGSTRSQSELLSAAKLVLRTAKREGRNRVCYWEKPSYVEGPAETKDLVNELQTKFADLERELRAYGNTEVKSLLDEIDIPDGLSEDHAENVAYIAAFIADELKLPQDQIDAIISAALLHDIGKAGIDSEILAKESPLTPEEFEIIKTHPNLGVEFLRESHFFEKELPMILHHHERYDGKGYPNGLRGQDIPLGARIISIAETIDGLLSGTAYRESLSIAETIRELQRCSGTQFDPQLVQIAIRLLETGKIG